MTENSKIQRRIHFETSNIKLKNKTTDLINLLQINTSKDYVGLFIRVYK